MSPHSSLLGGAMVSIWNAPMGSWVSLWKSSSWCYFRRWWKFQEVVLASQEALHWECSWPILGSLLPVCHDIEQQLPVSSTHSSLSWQPACHWRHIMEPADFRLNPDETVKQNNPLLPLPLWSCLGQVVYQQEKKPMPEESPLFLKAQFTRVSTMEMSKH